MKKTIRFPWMALLLCLILSVAGGISTAAEPIEIVYSDRGYMPFYTGVKSKGNVRGVFSELLREFELRHPEYRIGRRYLSRIRMDMCLKAGEADAFALHSPSFATDEQNRAFAFTEPILRTSDTLFTSQDRSFTFQIPQDLYGRTIAVIRGNSHRYPGLDLESHFGPEKIQRHDLDSTSQMIQMTLAGRLDGFIGNTHVVSYLLRKEKREGAGLVPSGVLFAFDLALMVKKEKTEFLGRFNLFVREAKSNGLLAGIESQYY